MPFVNDPAYGLKPALSLAGGSPTTLAQGSAPFFPGGGRRSLDLIPGADGRFRTVSFERMYREHVWVRTAATRLTEQIARLPLHAYEWLDDSGERRQRTRTHPVAELLGKPRRRRRGFHLRWSIGLGLLVHGNWLAWKKRPNKAAPPNELWALDWRFIVPRKLGEQGPVIAWEWRGRGIPGLDYGELLFPEDVVHLAFDAPAGDVGVSPLEALGVTLRGDDAATRLMMSTLAHGARFGAAIVLDGKAGKDKPTRDAVREALRDRHGGPDLGGLDLVLGGGVTDVKILEGQTAVDVELIAYRKLNREEVAACYGAPPPLIGILDEANYNALEEFHRLLYVTVLAGPLGLIAEGLQAQLIDDEPAWEDDGVFLEFNLNEVLKGDVGKRFEAYAKAIDKGILTLNDVRRLENLVPYDVPGADEPLILANNVRTLRQITEGGGDDPVKHVGNSILALVGKSSKRAIDRAVKATTGGNARKWDRDRFIRELGADLERAGHLDAAQGLVDATANALERDLAAATSVDDVRALSPRYV